MLRPSVRGSTLRLPRAIVKAQHRSYPALALQCRIPCVLEAGVLDTGDILKTAIDQRLGLTITDEAKAAYGVFRRIWQQPTDEQRRAVSERALRIDAGNVLRSPPRPR